jgi:MFS family permease
MTGSGRDSRGWIVVVLSILAVGSSVNLQMPLFPQYAATADFGNTGRALLFAAYILGLVPTLAFAGGASDVLGRRPVLLAAITASSLATLAIILWPTVHVLLGARLFHGMAVALGLGSATAWLTERLGDPKRAAWWSSVVTATAFGGGGLITTVVIALFGGGLTPWSYHLGLALLVVVGILILRVPGGISGTGGRWLRLPAFPPGTRLFTLGSCLSWSVSGIILAQGPAAMATVGLPTGAGIGVFVLCGTGALVQLIPRLRPTAPRVGMLVGACCSTAGLVLFDLGVRTGSPALLLAGYASAGAAGFGFMYLAGLTAVNAAAGDRRAAAVSGFLLGSYTGFGVPCMILALFADRIGEVTALSWGVALVAIAFTVLLLVIRAHPTPVVAARPAG